MSVNTVTDADFTLRLKPGTIVVDDNGSYQIKGDKEILLNELADTAKERSERRPVHRRRMWPLYLGIPLLAVVISYMFWRAWRAWRGRSGRAQPPPTESAPEA